MNTKNISALALSGLLLVGCVTGCITAVANQSGNTFPISTTSPQISNMSAPSLSVTAETGWADTDVSYEDQFKPYEQFGLTYDVAKMSCNTTAKWYDGLRTTIP